MTFCSSREIVFDSQKITAAILKSCQEEHRFLDDGFLTELNALLNAMYGSEDAAETWEENRYRRNEELRLSNERKLMHNHLDPDYLKKLTSRQEAVKTLLLASKNKLERATQRQPQGDGKSTRLAAVMPVPPMISMEGGQFYTQGIGV